MNLLNQFRKVTGRIQVKLMGRKSKREKRLARKAEVKNMMGKTGIQTGKVTEGSNGAKVTPVSNTNPVKSTTTFTTGSNMLYSDHHHLPTFLCNIGEFNLWAATKTEIELSDFRTIDLVVNCSQSSLGLGSHNGIIKGNPIFGDRLSKHILNANELFLDWNDGGDFPAPIAFWNELYDICAEQKYRNILFCCLGGHGRTGTALLSFVISNTKHEFNCSEHLVDKLRATYCKQTVETIVQENYLEALDREKGKSTDLGHNFPLLWAAYKPQLRQVSYKGNYSWENNKAAANTNNGAIGAKTLTQVIAEAQEAQKQKEMLRTDIFTGNGDTSALALSESEQATEANKAIVIDMLSAEERKAVDSGICRQCGDNLYTQNEITDKLCYQCNDSSDDEKGRSDTLRALEEFDREQTFVEVKDCYCNGSYVCMNCERHIEGKE